MGIIWILCLFLALLLSFIYYKTKVFNSTQWDKIMFKFFVGFFIFVCLVFALDYYNIPTVLGFGENLDLQNWLSIYTSGAVAFFACFLGILFSTLIDMEQIGKGERDSKPMNVLPALRYEFSQPRIIAKKNLYSVETISSTDIKIIYIKLQIKNIDYANVENLLIKVNGRVLITPIE